MYKERKKKTQSQSEKNELIARKQEMMVFTPTVHATNPAFSLWSITTKNRMTVPTYHGTAARKKPAMNLLWSKKKKLKNTS